MSDLGLYISASALDAQQAGMDVVAQNMANVNTQGYVQERVDLSTVGGGIAGIGGGVSASGVTQISSSLAQSASYAASALQSSFAAYSNILQSAQANFPEPNGGGIQSQLSTFWNAWDGVANDPTAPAPRQELVSTAQQLAASVNQAYNSLVQEQNQGVSEIQSAAGQVNKLLSQVAALNGQISDVKAAGGDVSSLIDQMNQLTSQLSNLVGATSQTTPGASTIVRLGGFTLVQGNQVVDTLKVATSGGGPTLSVSVDSSLTGLAFPVTAGTIAGQVKGVATLGSYESQMNGVAADLATTVNNQLAAGGYWSGGALVTPGPPMFVNSGTGTTAGITASDITVSPTIVANPSQIAASSATATGPNDGSNAQILANDFNVVGGPDQAYQAFIATLGSNVQSATNELQAQQAVAQTANANLQQISGVNPNEQGANMLLYQQAYQAATKMLTTIDVAMQSLLAAV